MNRFRLIFLALFFSLALKPVYGFTYLCKVEESNAIDTSILWGFEISNDFTQLTYVSFMNTAKLKSSKFRVPKTVLYSDKKNMIAVEIDHEDLDLIPLFVRIYWFDFEKDIMVTRFGNEPLENKYALFKCNKQ